MDIIQRNFFRLLRSGAFGDKTAIEPMSPFKWRRLYQMVQAQKVIPVFTQGANRHIHDEGMNLPKELIDEINEILDSKQGLQKRITDNHYTLSSKILAHRQKKIINDERHSIDTSVEALDLLKIIVFNVNAMLNYGLSMDGIIQLGQYLRTRGDKVDFVKLETWINHLHIQRMAQLQGSILISLFGFEKDEIPFVLREEPKAYKITIKAISNLAKDTAEEWHFRQNQTGFVSNNSSALRRNLRRSYRYIEFAPWETVSNFFHNFALSLQEIEE